MSRIRVFENSVQDQGNVRSDLDRTRSTSLVSAGVLAGVVAGLIMILVFMVRSSLAGYGFFSPVNLIAATWLGFDALAGGVTTGLLGLVTHLAVAGFWGAMFAMIAGKNERSAPASFWIGILMSAGVWALMTYYVVPWVNPALALRIGEVSGWWFSYHMIYGASLALGAPILNAITRRDSSPAFSRA